MAEGLVYPRNRGAWRRRDCISSERSERRRRLNAGCEDVAAHDRGQDGCDSREEAAVERRGGCAAEFGIMFINIENLKGV